MTQRLSLSAQAVFDSYKAASDGCYSGGEWLQNEAGQIAAALRVAADQMSSHHSKAYLYSLADGLTLLAIAAELEAQ